MHIYILLMFAIICNYNIYKVSCFHIPSTSWLVASIASCLASSVWPPDRHILWVAFWDSSLLFPRKNVWLKRAFDVVRINYTLQSLSSSNISCMFVWRPNHSLFVAYWNGTFTRVCALFIHSSYALINWSYIISFASRSSSGNALVIFVLYVFSSCIMVGRFATSQLLLSLLVLENVKYEVFQHHAICWYIGCLKSVAKS